MFNKISWIIVAVSMLSGSITWASGTLVLRNNLIDPSGKKSYVSQDINLYLTLSEKLSFGLETTSVPKNDYLKIKPFASWAMDKNWSLIGGYSTDSTDSEFVHGGLSYFASLGKSDTLYVSSCYYIGLGGQSDFLDSFIELKHDFKNGFALALEVAHDYWFESENNWLLIGPVVYYKVSEKVSIFSRIGAESDLKEMNSIDLRIGLKYSF